MECRTGYTAPPCPFPRIPPHHSTSYDRHCLPSCRKENPTPSLMLFLLLQRPFLDLLRPLGEATWVLTRGVFLPQVGERVRAERRDPGGVLGKRNCLGLARGRCRVGTAAPQVSLEHTSTTGLAGQHQEKKLLQHHRSRWTACLAESLSGLVGLRHEELVAPFPRCKLRHEELVPSSGCLTKLSTRICSSSTSSWSALDDAQSVRRLSHHSVLDGRGRTWCGRVLGEIGGRRGRPMAARATVDVLSEEEALLLLEVCYCTSAGRIRSGRISERWSCI